MPDFNREEAQQYQDRLVQRSLEIYHTLGREVIDYYQQDRVDNETDARENLFGFRKWIRIVRDDLNRLADEIDGRLGD